MSVFLPYRYPAALVYRAGIVALAVGAVVPATVAIVAFASGRGRALAIGLTLTLIVGATWFLCVRWWLALERRDGGGYGVTIGAESLRTVDWDVADDHVSEIRWADVAAIEERADDRRTLLDVVARHGERVPIQLDRLDGSALAVLRAVLPPPGPSDEQVAIAAHVRRAVADVLAIDIDDVCTPVADTREGVVVWTFRFGRHPAVEFEPDDGSYRVVGLKGPNGPLALVFVAAASDGRSNGATWFAPDLDADLRGRLADAMHEPRRG